MTARAAQEQAPDRRIVLRGAMQRPHHERLVDRQLAVVPVALHGPELRLDIGRRQELIADDQ
jgi:hypothetical protein